MKNRKKHRSRSERARLVAEWRASGKSQREFSLEHGLNKSTLAGWIRQERLGGAKGAQLAGPVPAPSGFAEVRVVQDRPVSRSSLVEVTTPGGYVVRIAGDLEAPLLRALLEEVGRC
jgi:transposase-like protein